MTTEPAVAKARGSARAPERRYEAPAHTDTARSGSAVRCARPGPATPPGRASATSSPAPHRRVVGSRHAGRPRVADPTWCGPPRSALQRWVQRINQRPAERLRRKRPELDCRAVEGGSQCNESATPDRGWSVATGTGASPCQLRVLSQLHGPTGTTRLLRPARTGGLLGGREAGADTPADRSRLRGYVRLVGPADASRQCAAS